MVLICKNIIQSLFEISPVVLEKDVSSVNVLSLFPYHPSLIKDMALHLNKFESTSHKDALHQVWLKLAQCFWRRKCLKLCQCNFAISLLSPPWKRAWSFNWISLIPLYPGLLFAKFGWKWLSGSDDEDFKKFLNFFCYFDNFYLPLNKGMAFIWTNLNLLYPRIL